MRPSARRGSRSSRTWAKQIEGVRTSAKGPAGRPKALPRSAPPYCVDRSLPKLDPVLLRRTVEDADIRIPLMVVFHLSGDLKWLGPAARRPADRR